MNDMIKRHGKVLIGIFVGVFLMSGVSYAVNSLSSESVSYTKKSGELTTVKQALDELISKSLTEIDSLKEKVDGYEKTVHYLADQVQIGDYVAYDAGNWDTTVDKQSAHGKFSGYTQGKSKNASISVCHPSSSTSLQGWRVLSKDEKQKTVTIVHAGQSECYFHGYGDGYNIESVNLLNERAKQYINSKYAASAHAMKYEEAQTIEQSSNLRNIGSRYWLGTVAGEWWVRSVFEDGGFNTNHSNLYGYRPVVVLKTGILTTGKGQDEFDQDAWQLVEMK